MTDFDVLMAAAKANYLELYFDPAKGGDPDATWDYHVSGTGSEQTTIAINNAAYQAAVAQAEPGESLEDTERRMHRILDEIADPLAGYRKERSQRAYTGWSAASDGKIRYAG